ncbi:MAG: STAS-like domain-containing protein [Verrucomicrobia bacterium]|nr:STAS-like domain-containing protein [Verrucomicrobiota bacterium]
MNVNIQQLVGPLCMTYEDGEKLHAAYRPAFDRGETIFLDFSGTRIFVSQFFNAAVGQLFKEHGIEEVRSRLKFQNLPAAANAPLRRSVENAERYYRDEKYREALDRVLADQAVEA